MPQDLQMSYYNMVVKILQRIVNGKKYGGNNAAYNDYSDLKMSQNIVIGEQ